MPSLAQAGVIADLVTAENPTTRASSVSSATFSARLVTEIIDTVVVRVNLLLIWTLLHRNVLFQMVLMQTMRIHLQHQMLAMVTAQRAKVQALRAVYPAIMELHPGQVSAAHQMA